MNTTLHAIDRDHGRNAHCTCGAEYSLVRNLNDHIDRENERVFEALADREDFLGFGYIGGRRHLSDARRQAADAMLARHVREHGVDEAALFSWANSRDGRFYADSWADGDAYGHAINLLP